MAQVQEYHDPNGLYPSPPQTQARFTYSLDSSAPLCNYQDLTRVAPMAQPLLRRPFRPEEHMQESQWPMSQECVPPPMSSSIMRAQSQLWEQLPTFDNSMMWNGLTNEPLIMSDADQSMLANSDLLYSQNARQHTLSKAGMEFGGTPFWASSGMSGLRRSNIMPSPEADILLSPVSPFSDTKHTYSPEPEGGHMTPSRGPASYAMKVSPSPGFVPTTPQSSCIIPRQPGSAAMHNFFASAITPDQAILMSNTVEQTEDVTQCSPTHSYEHEHSSSPGTTPWYPPGYRTEKSAMVQDSRSHQSATPPHDHSPNSSMTFIDRNVRHRQSQWSDRSSGVPAQSHLQTRFMAPITADEKAQRAADDETLLQMKQDGYTYKDIRKALRRKVAESTLRGRYRSLTKPRKQRVRAPKWTEIDVALLKRYVQDEFDKLDVTHPSLEPKQKPDKIPWMKIVENIAMTGGTYKFGAATAKKKWVEVTRSASARSSRRRSKA